MRPPKPAAKPAQRYEPEQHSCCICGEVAGFGLGPPLVDLLRWYCHPHWLWQPSTQAMFAGHLRAFLEEE